MIVIVKARFVIHYLQNIQIQDKMLFFDGIITMLQKQNLADYLYAAINKMKKNPGLKLESVLVQVVGGDLVSDGVTNFQCVFKKPVRKGAYLRLTDWDVDLKNFQLIIYAFQLLGGEGYSVRSGKPWDTEKLRYLQNSKLYSSDYVILHSPDATIQPVLLPQISSQTPQKNQSTPIPSNCIKSTPSKPIVRPTTQNTTSFIAQKKIAKQENGSYKKQTEELQNLNDLKNGNTESSGHKFQMRQIKRLLEEQ